MTAPGPTSPALNEILKGVSRSFYLSIRILPKKIRPTVSLAYLLARAADTLSDSASLPPKTRLEFLKQFQNQLEKKAETSTESEFFQNLNLTFKNHDHDKEWQLLQNLPELFSLFWQMDAPLQQMTHKVLRTLTQGMCEDLEYFSSSQLKCLKTIADTERYAYLVAGCVGEFWTTLLIQEYLKIWNQADMVAIAIRFGQGLQMINILRDLPKDFSIQRCYLSQDDFDRFELNLKTLGDLVLKKAEPDGQSQTLHQMRALYDQKIELTRRWLASGLKYTQAIPPSCLRLRLSVLWPLFIGLETLNALKSNFITTLLEKPVRISRKQVYRIMLTTFFLAPSNTLLSWYFQRKGGPFLP